MKSGKCPWFFIFSLVCFDLFRVPGGTLICLPQVSGSKGGLVQWSSHSAVCVDEALSRKGLSWPSLCSSQVLDKGTEKTHRCQCSGQRECPTMLKKVTRTWSWKISQKQWNCQRRKMRPHLAQGNKAEKIVRKSAPKSIPRSVLRSVLLHQMLWPMQKDTGRRYLVVLSVALSGSAIVLQNWVMESWSCLACAKSSAGTCSTRSSCHVLSFLSWGWWGFCGPKNLTQPKQIQKICLLLVHPFLVQHCKLFLMSFKFHVSSNISTAQPWSTHVHPPLLLQDFSCIGLSMRVKHEVCVQHCHGSELKVCLVCPLQVRYANKVATTLLERHANNQNSKHSHATTAKPQEDLRSYLSRFLCGAVVLNELGIIDGQNRARVIAESLARVITAIRITSVRLQSYLPQWHRNYSS